MKKLIIFFLLGILPYTMRGTMKENACLTRNVSSQPVMSVPVAAFDPNGTFYYKERYYLMNLYNRRTDGGTGGIICASSWAISPSNPY